MEQSPLASRVGAQPVKGEERTPIALELDRTLLVRVVDSRGEPQPDLPVGLELRSGSGSRQWIESTQSEGLATFRHAGVGLALGAGAGATVSLLGIFERPIETSFPLADWPAAPLELVLPEHGTVVIEVLDEGGELQGDLRRTVELRLEHELLTGAALASQRQPLAAGRARFPAVGLGLELQACVDLRPAAARTSTTLRGPLHAGEEVVARLALSAPRAWIVFRALDEQGLPLQGPLEGSITLVSRLVTLGGGGFFLEPDSTGRVRLALLDPWEEGATLTLDLLQRREGSEARTATVDLSRAFPSGESDLGAVVFRAPPVLVAGHVVDEGGAPVAGAALQLQARADRGGRDEPGWQAVLWERSGADGSFAFRDGEIQGELRLVVAARELAAPEPLAVARGARDVRIVLARGGIIAGSLVPLPGVPPYAFRIQAEVAPGELKEAHVALDGSFALGGLAPGRVDVALAIRAGGTPVLEVPGVAVVDGQTTRDPRLQAIDLASLASALRVRVRRLDGEPANDGWVRVLAGTDGRAAFLIEDGETLVIGRREPLDLEVRVPGFRIERLLGVERDQEVVLRPAFRVRLELASEAELPEGDCKLQVRLQRQTLPGEAEPARALELFCGGKTRGTWDDYFGDTTSFDAAREVLVSVLEPGTYALELYLVLSRPDGGQASWQVATKAGTLPLELDERDADATFRVTPDPEAYASARSSAR